MKIIRYILVFVLFFQVSLIKAQTEKPVSSISFGIDPNNPNVYSKIKFVNFPNKLSIEGRSNEITMEQYGEISKSERAEGLRLLGMSGAGFDNGISREVKKGVLIFSCSLPANSDVNYKFYIDKLQAIEVEMGGMNKGDLEISNLNSEIEIDVISSNIILNKVTGPLVISSAIGNISAQFSKLNQTSPVSIKSVSGQIDVSLPEKTAANFELKSMSGKIYSDFESNAKTEIKQKQEGNSSTLTGILNSGGVKLMIFSFSGNINLHKIK